jgi:hypothetical protein
VGEGGNGVAVPVRVQGAKAASRSVSDDGIDNIQRSDSDSAQARRLHHRAVFQRRGVRSIGGDPDAFQRRGLRSIGRDHDAFQRRGVRSIGGDPDAFQRRGLRSSSS